MCTYPFGVMIVDDNDADVETIERGLLGLDPPPRVVVYRTAGEALEALHTQDELSGATVPYAVLVEADLPLVSGLEFVACMRCDPGLRHIPVFVLTDSSVESHQPAAHTVGVAGYLRKPTMPGESKAIAARIERYVCSGNPSDRLRQAGHGRTRVACLPRRVAGASKQPASQRRSTAARAG